jgi:hypothetical protein
MIRSTRWSFQMVAKVQGSVQNHTGGVDRVERSIWCVHLSNSYLQTRWSCYNREDNASGRLKDEEVFPSPSVHHSITVTLIQFVDNSISSQLSAASALFIPTFFVWWYHTPCYLQMRGFSSFPQFWLFRWSWERWVILLQYGLVLGTFLVLISLDGFCTFACGALVGILHLYARTTLLRRFVFCAHVFVILSRTLSLHDKTRNSRFRFLFWVLHRTEDFNPHVRERGEWMNGWDFTQWFHRHLHRMHLSKCGHPRMTSQRYPSRRYILHVDTRGSLYPIS